MLHQLARTRFESYAANRRHEYAHYRKLVVMGYSIGGHMALRAAVDGIDPRPSAVIAVSPPSVRVPVLIVGSNHDPVIPVSVMKNAVRGASRSIVTRWIDGTGHLHFPADTDLGFGPAPRGLASQCMHWAKSCMA